MVFGISCLLLVGTLRAGGHTGAETRSLINTPITTAFNAWL